MTPTVTAVIPTVGRATLHRAVQSVLGQTLPVAEVIVVADTDDPIRLPADDRIVLIHSHCRGSSLYCRQLGINAAQGAVVALLDDDDEWYPDKLARQLDAVNVAG